MQRFDLGQLFCLERIRDGFCSRITNKATDSTIMLDFQWLWFKVRFRDEWQVICFTSSSGLLVKLKNKMCLGIVLHDNLERDFVMEQLSALL